MVYPVGWSWLTATTRLTRFFLGAAEKESDSHISTFFGELHITKVLILILITKKNYNHWHAYLFRKWPVRCQFCPALVKTINSTDILSIALTAKTRSILRLPESCRKANWILLLIVSNWYNAPFRAQQLKRKRVLHLYPVWPKTIQTAQFPSHIINHSSIITADVLGSIKMCYHGGNSKEDKCNGLGSTLRKSVFTPQEMDPSRSPQPSSWCSKNSCWSRTYTGNAIWLVNVLQVRK